MSATIFGASTPTDADLDRFFDTVLDSAARPVFMHCVHGKDRTGAMAAIYRIEVSGWTSQQAIAEMDRLGFNGMYRKLHGYVRDYKPRGYVARRRMIRVD
jgi:protein tyrosine/serine phosphatase